MVLLVTILLFGKFSNYVTAKHGVKAKLPFLLRSEKEQKIVRRLNIEHRKYINPVAIPFKIELAKINLELLLKELPNIISQLKSEDH